MKAVVTRLTNLRQHPDQPRLVVADAAGRQVVTGDHYEEGVLGVFFDDGCVLPDHLLEEMWLKGRLSGAGKNRVKARKNHGVDSAGVFYGSRYWLEADGARVWHAGPSFDPAWTEGRDVTRELLG